MIKGCETNKVLPLSSHKPIIDCLFVLIDSVVIARKAISLDQHKDDVGTLYPIDDD